jgi:hypothetical protein
VTRAARIEQCARDLIAAIDKNLDTLPWPVKYGVPFREALALREAIDGVAPGHYSEDIAE